MNRLLSATAIALVLGVTAVMAETPASPPTNKPGTVENKAAPAGSTAIATNKDLTLTDAQAKNWLKKAVISSDGKNVGEVTAIKRDSSGTVTELQAGIGGFLGIGETKVQVMPSQFTLQNDRVELSLTSEQVKTLPRVVKVGS
jgi:hypothetical protein